ncbi:MAG: Type 1 glutamine amidotransferase-like domain-containing protein [Bacilli bacterium]|nr:Type 1 glutamine amidotransferase-like domain-containing protein [Bacilli bacterium]
MGKKTLFFSNIIGDIMSNDINSKFNDYMEEYLKKNINSDYSMIFIDAPGLGGEENYLPNIIRCFNRIGIDFKSIIHVNSNTLRSNIDDFLLNNNKILYFLMGGNPYTQIETIKRLNMIEEIKNHNDLVIGFCAGAINLSKYSILTSDEDFPEVDNYEGIDREDICVEPHYNNPYDIKRNNELQDFSNKLNTNIYCVPDKSIIYFENGIKTEKGIIYTVEKENI